MRRRTRKIWAGMGLAVAAGHAPAVLAQGHTGHGAVAPPASASDGNVIAPAQGGETYLTDGGPRDTRIRIYRDIILIRGHLLVGSELVELGLWDEALPHFLHPTEELYGGMERYIKLHHVTPFDRQLKAQAQAVKARNKPALQQAARLVDERLTVALAAFRRFMTGRPFSAYTMETLVEVLRAAQGEYETSFEQGRIAKPVEYQDGRGFALYAERLLAGMREELAQRDAAGLPLVSAAFERVKAAWPTPTAPEAPPIEQQALKVRIDEFAKAAARYY
ncbi:MAG: hypothetical protein JSS20_04395 [Proteobacteria bacterium]|nr:hypothetical protein [Pseudomonadota bacterium]